MWRATITCWLVWFVAFSLRAADDVGLEAPPGFEVSLFAGDELAHNIYSLTIDSHGRVVVAGPGYVKILHDDDGDGRADRATLFSNQPASGAQGMYFDGDSLLCTGDNALLRLVDADGDGRADGEPEIWARFRSAEHGAHGVVRGPDGWIYVVCGNDAGVSEEHVQLDRSPVKHPRCGAILRFRPGDHRSEVYAHGFRNCYDIDFGPGGQLFTVDSDNERDYHLPWYAPTRLFDVAQGQEHGWLLAGWTKSWNRPECFFDNVERACEFGRGSPTGLVVYRHRQFPPEYRGNVFSACWTKGVIYRVPLAPHGSSFRGAPKVFVKTRGDLGFAPCDLAVGPAGDLFIAIGGRGTRGSVFRVRYANAEPLADEPDPLRQVLAADQPLASWSRARWAPLARKLGAEPFEKAVLDDSLPVEMRVRAVEVVTELYASVLPALAKSLPPETHPHVLASAAWAMPYLDDQKSTRILADWTSNADEFVARAAWDALAIRGPLDANIRPDWSRAMASSDRRVRAAAVAAAAGSVTASYEQASASFKVDGDTNEGWSRIAFNARVHQALGRHSLDDFSDSTIILTRDSPAWLSLEAIRLLQLALGDVRWQPDQPELYAGYVAATCEQIPANLRLIGAQAAASKLHCDDRTVRREASRLLAMLEIDHHDIFGGLTWQFRDDDRPETSVHDMIVNSRMPGTPDSDLERQIIALTLLQLHQKVIDEGGQPSNNWPLRIGELFTAVCQRDDKLADYLVDFKFAPSPVAFGRPEHALYAARMEGAVRERAIRKLVEYATKNAAEPTAELVQLAGELPLEESLPFLRSSWEHVGLRDDIAVVLARHALAEDRDRLVEALASPQPEVVKQLAESLTRTPSDATPRDVAAALRALRNISAEKRFAATARSLDRLLAHWTDNAVPDDARNADDLRAAYLAWSEWFTQTHPAEAAALGGGSTEDAAAWTKRLAVIDWAAGAADRGKLVFQKRTCQRCHEAAGHLGPALDGAARRLSRDDLFTAIRDPNLEVSPTYQTTTVVTRSGQVYTGLVVYDSPEGTLLQTGPDTTVRIGENDGASQAKSNVSLMPTGLLNDLADGELADLYAYLKTLAKP